MAESKNPGTDRHGQEHATTYLDLSELRHTRRTAQAALAVAIIAILFSGGLGIYAYNALRKAGASDGQVRGMEMAQSEQEASTDDLSATVDQRVSNLRTDMERRLASREDTMDQRIAALEQSMLAKLRSLESQTVSPEQVTQQINSQQAHAALREVVGQTEALGDRIDDPQLQEKLTQAQKLLSELGQEVRR